MGSVIALAACTETPQPQPRYQVTDYPEAFKDETVVDNYFGTEVADPYRWLENDTSAETNAWVEAERKVTELEKELENSQASMYCDVVDANMLNVKYQDKVKRMTECLKNCLDVFNAVGPELLGTDNILVIQGVASAQNWVQRILDEPEVK